MKLPCKDCICFPICKVRYITCYKEYPDKRAPLIGARMGLCDTCELINDWLYEDTSSIYIKKVEMIHDLFYNEEILDGH
jgi:hypothetical protein